MWLEHGIAPDVDAQRRAPVLVELGRHRRALAPEQAREGVADGRRAPVDDDERAGGIRRHELQPDAPSGLALATSVGDALAEDFRERAGAPRRRQEDVEKPRPRDLDALDLGHRREVLDDEVGDLSRRALRDARQDHRRIRRVVAVLRLARDFPRVRVGLGQARLRERRPHAVGQPIGEPHSRNRVPARHGVVTKKKRPITRARGPARDAIRECAPCGDAGSRTREPTPVHAHLRHREVA